MQLTMRLWPTQIRRCETHVPPRLRTIYTVCAARKSRNILHSLHFVPTKTAVQASLFLRPSLGTFAVLFKALQTMGLIIEDPTQAKVHDFIDHGRKIGDLVGGRRQPGHHLLDASQDASRHNATITWTHERH
jgi:hypothetical protein